MKHIQPFVLHFTREFVAGPLSGTTMEETMRFATAELAAGWVLAMKGIKYTPFGSGYKIVNASFFNHREEV